MNENQQQHIDIRRAVAEHRRAVAEHRRAVAEHCRAMLRAGLTTGSGGNISVRLSQEDMMCISPSGIPYEQLRAESVTVCRFDGSVVEGDALPSSELAMHAAVYRARDDAQAIVHTHSPYATTFACLREAIPATHYLVGFAGTQVPVAPYATYGSAELATNAVATLGKEYHATLLANHGLLALASTLERAFAIAEEVELVARVHYQARCIGTPVVLDDEEMRRVIEKFRDYGVRSGRERR
ncbi:MAG: class II aldolase/adducin family protein [Bacteroidota bacterium]|nr:class II aldolase/adducin family protein [Bacteroidota bacterium]